jgi:hypothetical protein
VSRLGLTLTRAPVSSRGNTMTESAPFQDKDGTCALPRVLRRSRVHGLEILRLRGIATRQIRLSQRMDAHLPRKE